MSLFDRRGKLKLFIELADHVLKLQWVKPLAPWKSAGFTIESTEWVWLDRGMSLVEALRSRLKQNSSLRQAYPIETILLIPLNNGFLREVTVPPLPRAKLKRSIKYLLEEEVLLPPSDRLYDYLKLSERRVLIGAARRKYILNLQQELGSIGLKVVRVDFAVSRVLNTLALSAEATVLYLEQDENSVYFGAIRGNTPDFLMVLPIDGELMAQVYRQLRFYQSGHSLRPFQRIVVSGNIAQSIAQHLIQEGFAEEWTEIRPTRILPAQGMNLLREVHLEREIVRYKRLALAAAFSGLIMGAVPSWTTYSQVNELRHNVTELENSLTELKQGVIAVKQQQEAWESVQRNSFHLERELGELQAIVPSGVTLKEIELTPSRVLMQGKANSGSEVQALMLALKDTGWQEVALLDFSQDHTGHTQFVLTSTR